MNALDYLVLFSTLVGIAGYGIWRTRKPHTLETYLKGSGDTRWLTIGLSVMATQASAITFLSATGQGYQDGLRFVQNYFGAPLALIFISVVFLPIYRRLNVITAYEYLGKRFDTKTRLLGAGLFMVQRALGAGITIYAPAIVLSTVMGWRLDLTIIGTGLIATVCTVSGGSDAVSITQKYQLGVIFAGLFVAAGVLLAKLPPALTFTDAMSLAGGFAKLQAVDYSVDPNRRYTFWTGLLGGGFLALSYFGTDQSQVGRYLTGASLRESRLGLMFNAVCKIPMQFGILLLGVLMFVFYQFELPPLIFNTTAWNQQVAHGDADHRLRDLQSAYDAGHVRERRAVEQWLDARHAENAALADTARREAQLAADALGKLRDQARARLREANPNTSSNDDDYIFIHFILRHLPHGVIGLLVAVLFSAAISSKAGELNALGSTTTVDFYRHLARPGRDDAHYVRASKLFTALWGVVAIGFALGARLAENLIQASNILGSVFYGVVLGLFLVAFFLPRIGGTAVFWGALGAQALVFVLYKFSPIAYLWYNVIGPAACVGFSLVVQRFVPPEPETAAL